VVNAGKAARAVLACLLAGCDSGTVNDSHFGAPATTVRVSLSWLDQEGNADFAGGMYAADATTVGGLLSGDGHAVAFNTWSEPFHPDVTSATGGLYVKNLVTRELYLASRKSGAAGDVSPTAGDAGGLSRDGRRLVFVTTSALDPADTDALKDMYVRDLDTHETILVSRAGDAAGTKANGECHVAVISADGLHVAFTSTATNLDPADTDPGLDVYVRDLAAGVTELVSRASGGGPRADALSLVEAISEDGSRIVFQTAATNLGTPGGKKQLYVRDRAASTVTLVSRAAGPAGAAGNDDSFTAAITADGLQVAFSSTAGNLHPGDADKGTDVFVRDLAADTLELVSRASGEGGVKALSPFTSQGVSVRISRDGRYVAFESLAANLVPDDTNGRWDVFLRDRSSANTQRVTVRAFGSQLSGYLELSGMSDDGSAVMFLGNAEDIVDGDTNQVHDFFLRRPLR
jgi:Tol biopolymer transport system component